MTDSEQKHAEAQREREDALSAAIKFVTENLDEVVKWEDPHLTIWTGTQEELISQGVCTPEQFPAGRKRVLRDPTFDPTLEDRNDWETRRILGRICEHIIRHRGKERDRILRERKPLPERGKEYDSPEAYAEYTESFWGWRLNVLKEEISGQAERKTHGATTLLYDKDTVARVIAACDAIEQYIQAGTVGWTKAAGAERKRRWNQEYQLWRRQKLGKDRWVYLWADGIYSGLRAEDERLCALVVIGVNERGQKHFLAIEDGMRESKTSWADLLRDLKRGLEVPPKLAVGDGALGFWAALEEISRRRGSSAAGCTRRRTC